ncbi:RNA-directed RNA polymerase QDE-1 [Handroanthus impetiginosus]|uniref:RNA-dependent RNA polymerase n=1 Tax=Handroanthus impetiginosus TaxID=429701 RepID=A0A2G9H823_9LAMI|nr:RNA-directed RNA polymerase QDE-1 [Handroanthus impetiginosus]
MEASPRKEAQCPLPQSVEKIIVDICNDQSQPLLPNAVRRLLAEIGEKAALELLLRIKGQNITKSFSGYVITLLKKYHPSLFPSPSNSPNKRPLSPSCSSPNSSPLKKSPPQISRMQSLRDEALDWKGPNVAPESSSTGELKEMTNRATISEQLKILSKLEYRKLFLVLSYIGRQKLEDVMTIDGTNDIVNKKDLQMTTFEAEIWKTYGNKYCDRSDRRQYLNWDSGKTYFYYCYVHQDGSYHFEGPSLNNTRNHLQRVLGDENVLIVKFLGDDIHGFYTIEREGILVGPRRFQFLVFKDEQNRHKKNQTEEKKATSAVKAHFVRIGYVEPKFEDKTYILSGKSIGEARRLFMHVHKVLTMEKYMARFSLVLSTTIKLQINFGDVKVETIEDIPFRDDSGSLVRDEDGDLLIHTDGTGFISEDLAMNCPEDFSVAKYITDNSFETYHVTDSKDISCQTRPPKPRSKEPPLLMQCRLFYNGMAVKGTLLLNKKLKPGVIQVRPSMIKVRGGSELPVEEKFNSLEIVDVSHRPHRTYLSKMLICLLTYGEVPPQFFLNLLTNALEDTQKVCSDKRSALKVASNQDGLDYGFAAQIMISCGIPLNEPYLQHCLRNLRKDGKSKLKKGKIPISESFYLMGTADPTGVLDNGQVCVILDNGQLSGKVLVYRNPGLHFGDIHVMEAVYVKELEEYVGNSKYGIFFSTKGSKSAAYEMATGDFDGDMYWISRHPELLRHFKTSEPWRRSCSTTMPSNSRKPQELSSEELEHELFRRYIEARRPSFDMPSAANSWLAFMDRLLTLGDHRASEKNCLRKKIIQLIDIYYDAIDAPKSGKRVHFPNNLKAEMYPHHMERGPEYSYHSSSILGQIYDIIEGYKDEAVPKTEIWKLPCFDLPTPEIYIDKWKTKYEDYRKEMTAALNSGHESKNDAANDVIKKYKQLLYDAPEMEESTKDTTVIYEEALAIYHVTYDYAKSANDCSKCNFAWKVAGSALCNLCAWKTAGPKEKPLMIVPSVLRDVLN